MSGPDQSVIDRASPTDLAFLAMDSGDVPEQFGVILLLDRVDGFDLARARRLITERIPAVPRLRQELIRVPFGCGGPVWVDDDDFDIRTHVRVMACPAPADERALLDAALSVIATPLPRTAPLWSAVFVTDLADGRDALVLVLHHVLADGVGGLAVLAHLVDRGTNAVRASVVEVSVPRPRPTAGMLAVDGFQRRLQALRRIRLNWRLLRASLAAGGGIRPPRATPCSLIQRTGQHRSLAVIRADIARLRAAAHRYGATTNDAVLVAVAGALHRVLLARGELVDTFAIAVPVSGRGNGGPALGNMVSPMLVTVPATGSVGQRLEQVGSQVRAHKESATGPPPIALLGWLFRKLAAHGVYRWYMDHQHRLHTLVSHVRGPDEPITFGGSPISSAIPVALAAGGNITVYFDVLSYAGTLTVTAIVDPDRFLDLDTLTDGLRAELDLIIHTPATSR
jgi:WS/DGAT/MGAT family acyltransferase